MTALTVEESEGHHILVEPCQRCVQRTVKQTVDDIRTEEHLEHRGAKVEGKEKLEEWKKETERREKELENVRKMERGEV